MVISQMVAAKLLKGASAPVTTGARGFLFGGFLNFTGASSAGGGGGAAALRLRTLMGLGK